jgi:hypothetical protein
MKRRAMSLGAIAVIVAGCGEPATFPEWDALEKADGALATLTGTSHRADVEVTVRVSTGWIPPFKMTAEMRGTYRAMPGSSPATDLDLPSVTTTVDRSATADLVRRGAVRVVTLGERTYVRNTLQSDQWLTPPRAPQVTGRRGYDPASTAGLMRTTLVAEMFRGQRSLLVSPATKPAAGERMSVFSIACEVAQCLAKSPEARRRALQVYPGDAMFTAELWVDDRDRPRRLTVNSEFVTGENKMGVSVDFQAAFVFHDLGAPQQITAPQN